MDIPAILSAIEKFASGHGLGWLVAIGCGWLLMRCQVAGTAKDAAIAQMNRDLLEIVKGGGRADVGHE